MVPYRTQVLRKESPGIARGARKISAESNNSFHQNSSWSRLHNLKSLRLSTKRLYLSNEALAQRIALDFASNDLLVDLLFFKTADNRSKRRLWRVRHRLRTANGAPPSGLSFVDMVFEIWAQPPINRDAFLAGCVFKLTFITCKSLLTFVYKPEKSDFIFSRRGEPSHVERLLEIQFSS